MVWHVGLWRQLNISLSLHADKALEYECFSSKKVFSSRRRRKSCAGFEMTANEADVSLKMIPKCIILSFKGGGLHFKEYHSGYKRVCTHWFILIIQLFQEYSPGVAYAEVFLSKYNINTVITIDSAWTWNFLSALSRAIPTNPMLSDLSGRNVEGLRGGEGFPNQTRGSDA